MRHILVITICFTLFAGCSNDHICSFGANLDDVSPGHACEVSEQFGTSEAKRLAQYLNSESFKDALARYNCGEQVPALLFRVDLCKRTKVGARRVEVHYLPTVAPVGYTRCLLFGLGYLIDKTIVDVDPTKVFTLVNRKPCGEEFQVKVDRSGREPVCNCAKRSQNLEWVTFEPNENN